MRKKLHTYQNNERTAEVYLNTEQGFEVDLIDNSKILETRELHKHSEQYAENCAENFVLGIFDVKAV